MQSVTNGGYVPPHKPKPVSYTKVLNAYFQRHPELITMRTKDIKEALSRELVRATGIQYRKLSDGGKIGRTRCIDKMVTFITQCKQNGYRVNGGRLELH